MKRFISALVSLVLICGTASAQYSGKHNFGLRAGIGISNLTKYEIAGVGSIDMNAKLAFQVGVSDQIRIIPHFPLFVETGLYYTHYGSSYNIVYEDSPNEKNIFRMGYLKIPALANIHIPITGDISLQVYAGPYYSLGIYGTGKIKYKDGNNNKIKEKYDLFKDNIDEGTRQLFKRSDFGLRFGIAASLEQYYLGLGCDFGLIDIAKVSNCNAKTANFFLTVGFNF